MNKQMNALTRTVLVITGLSGMLLLNSCGPSSNESPTSEATEPDASSTVTPLNVGDIERIHRMGPYYLASQPGASDFKQLKDRGIKTVINLRPHDETPDLNEADVVEGLGFTYYNVPIPGADGLNASSIHRVRQLLKTAERPVLLHCSSANRAGSVWLPYRVLDHGVPLEKAVDEAKTIGLRSSALEKKARSYVKQQKNERSPNR